MTNPRIPALSDDAAPATSRTILQAIEKAIGMAPNLHRTLAHAPAALRAYVDSVRALGGGNLPPALREQIAVATAGINGCAYCASAHTTMGRDAGVAPEELARNLTGESRDPKVAAVLALVRALVERRGAVSDDDVRAARSAGLSDADLVEVVAHVGLNVFTNMFNVFARTTIDFPVVELREAS